MMVGSKHHPKGALNSAPTTLLVCTLHHTCFVVDKVIASLSMFHCDGWLMSIKCKQKSYWAMVDIDIVAFE